MTAEAPRRLASVLADALDENGFARLDDLSVLSDKQDPYRLDVPRCREAGEWLAAEWERLGRRRDLHARGYHYALLGTAKPDGTAYANSDDDWTWLAGAALDGVRWLGMIPFDAITERRNTPPIRRYAPLTEAVRVVASGFVRVEASIASKPLAAVRFDDPLRPDAVVTRQPFRLAVFGEKSSLSPVVGPICREYGADLYLPSGEASDAMIHTLVRDAHYDGRPLRVFYLSDCDPAGKQMAISVARKLRAFKDLLFPGVEYQLLPVALTVDQVREFGLPSTPLKPSERRGDRWRAAYGVEQTEIDSLATLRPDLLARLLRDALDAHTDPTLQERLNDARRAWGNAAQEAVDERLGPDRLAEIEAAAARIDDLRADAAEIAEALAVDADEFDLPEFVPPVPDDERVYGDGFRPLVDSGWGYVDETLALKAAKRYEDGEDR